MIKWLFSAQFQLLQTHGAWEDGRRSASTCLHEITDKNRSQSGLGLQPSNWSVPHPSPSNLSPPRSQGPLYKAHLTESLPGLNPFTGFLLRLEHSRHQPRLRPGVFWSQSIMSPLLPQDRSLFQGYQPDGVPQNFSCALDFIPLHMQFPLP